MSDTNAHPLETILRLCEAAGPEPWYPKLHAEQNGVDRASLDPPLERLRLGGWLKLTDWMEGKGQGYRLTEQGQELVKDAHAMAAVHEGKLPAPPARAVTVEDQPATAWDRGEAVREAFLGGERPAATFVLIAACILIYLAGEAAAKEGPLAQLLRRGEVVGYVYIVDGQWWRLLSHAFFHAGPIHLAMNMFALYSLGGEAERLWGRNRFLTLYLLSALGGAMGVLLFTDTAALGASGAICGVFAASAVWLYRNHRYLPPTFVDAWKHSMLINGVLIGVISFWPGVSAWGHLGGAVAGALVAFLLDWQRFGNRRQRRAAYLGLAALPLLAIGSILVMEQTDSRWRKVSNLVQAERVLNEALTLYEQQIMPALEKDNPAALEQAQAALAPLKERLRRRNVQEPLGNDVLNTVDEFCETADQALRPDRSDLDVARLKLLVGQLRWDQQKLARIFAR